MPALASDIKKVTNMYFKAFVLDFKLAKGFYLRTGNLCDGKQGSDSRCSNFALSGCPRNLGSCVALVIRLLLRIFEEGICDVSCGVIVFPCSHKGVQLVLFYTIKRNRINNLVALTTHHTAALTSHNGVT